MAEMQYFYSAHSSFTYIGSARFMEIAAAAGRHIVHKPFDLNRALEAAGSIPFKERSSTYRAYFYDREAERWAEERKVPIMTTWPNYHYVDMTLVNCTLIASVHHGLDTNALSHAMLAGHWVDDADLSNPKSLSQIAATVDIDAAPLLAAAATPEIRAEYEANTQEAVTRGVMGSPTYFVDGDMFYGQDRLEMVERALKQPYTVVNFVR